MTRRQLAAQAVRAAMRLRAGFGIGPADAVCPFDLAEQIGIVVRLVALPSLEGMHTPDPRPIIFVSVERPAGRRRHTCGHELGHHVFRHGTRLDELADDLEVAWNPEEFVAYRFAEALLMPKLAVESAFARRGYSIRKPSPGNVFVVAQDLGVGYTTLVGYLERTLNCVATSIASALRRVSLPRLRSRLARFGIDYDLVLADEHWGRRSIDLEIGDIVLLPRNAEFKGVCAMYMRQPVPHLRAVAPGVASVTLDRDRKPTGVRVSRRGYSGLARYRYLEDTEDES